MNLEPIIQSEVSQKEKDKYRTLMEWPSWSTKESDAVLGCNLKNNRMISVHFQDKLFNIMVVQVYAPTVMQKKLKLNGSMKTYKTFQN